MSRKADGLIFAYLIRKGIRCLLLSVKLTAENMKRNIKNIVNDGGQLFSYWRQERSCKFLVLYASKYEGKQIKWDTESIDCSDDANIVALSQKDDSIKLLKMHIQFRNYIRCGMKRMKSDFREM